MKQFLIIALITLLAAACNGSHLKKSIMDNGKTMTIKVDAKNENQNIDYEQTFDVSNMDSTQKKALTARVFDSLGVQ